MDKEDAVVYTYAERILNAEAQAKVDEKVAQFEAQSDGLCGF